MSNETTDFYLNETFNSLNSSDSSILLTTLSDYDETYGVSQDYEDLYKEDTTIIDNVTLASSDEPFVFDWGLFYTGILNYTIPIS